MKSYTMPSRLTLACLLALLLITGCDTTDTGGGNIVLFARSDQGDIAALRFTFASENLQTNRLVDLVSTNRIDLTPFLQQNGFSRSEIVSASLESAQMEVVFPITEVASFLSQAILKLDAAGVSITEVAEQATFPSDSDEAPLVVRTDRNIAAILEQPDFGGVFQIDANRLRPNEDYEIVVTLSLRIEVEGF